MAAEWAWELCDGLGEPLCELTTAAGKKLTARRNHFVEASCVIGVQDDAALLLGEALATGWPRLKCWRRAASAYQAELVLNGHLAPIVAQAELASTLQLVARSPFSRLLGETGVSLPSDWTGVHTDLSGMLNDLLDFVTGAAGTAAQQTKLYPGTMEWTGLPGNTAFVFGQVIGDWIVEQSARLDGFDFVERFVDEAEAMAYLDLYVERGRHRPEAKFEFGEATLANLRSVSQTIAPPVNVVRLLGADGIQVERPEWESIAKYGVWPLTKSLTSITDSAMLNDRALGLQRPNPVRTVDMTPDPTAPRPWDDFDIGDTCPVYIDHGMIQVNEAVRLNGFTVVIDEDGFETSEIEDPLLADEEAAIRANLEIEVQTV